MAHSLNPYAPEFVPSNLVKDQASKAAGSLINLPEDPWNPGFESSYDYQYNYQAEEHLTESELEELEAAEEWVASMVELDDMEREHMIALALSMAPKEKLEEIHRRVQVPSAATSRVKASGKARRS